jgi:hypothetical protein
MLLHRPSVYLALFATSGLLASVSSASADCSFTPPLTTQTKCVQAVAIAGNKLLSYDISFFSTERNEYYLADRSNSGIDIIGRNHLTHKWEWKRTLGGFVGVKLNGAGTAINNNISGPDGVTSHGRWLYAGDGDSTLKVFDLDAPTAHAMKASILTFPGATTRLDEMALTSDGRLLIAANNAEDPPFATLFAANGDDEHNHVKKLVHITVDPAIMPTGFGLSLEQPAWDPKTRRFYTSIPIIAENPPGCNYGQPSPPHPTVPCDGGVLVTNPFNLSGPNVVQGPYDPHSNTGVVALHACGPNGSTVGPHDNMLFGCTPANNPNDVIQLVRNATTGKQTPIANITGSDEVWFNKGDDRYYTASNRNCKTFLPPGHTCPGAGDQAAVLGVINGETNKLIETVPQSSGSHSVAADSEHNFIFVPQNAGNAASPSTDFGHDTTNVGQGICGTGNGCVAVYQHKVPGRDGDHDEDDEVANNHRH